MKSLRRSDIASKRRLSLRVIANSAAYASALLFAVSAPVFGQGAYYPVFPEGAPYGNNYTGTPVLMVPELNYLEGALVGIYGPNVTLQIPVPTGKANPTTAQLTAAVQTAATGVLAGTSGSVTLESLAREVVAYKAVDRLSTVGAIAQVVVADGVLSAGDKSTKLTDVAVALAIAQPTYIDSLAQAIISKAQVNASVAQLAIPSVVVATVGQIPRDLVRTATIIGAGVNGISQGNLTNTQKHDYYVNPTDGLIKQVLSSSAVVNNPDLIDVAVRKFTEGNSLNFATLQEVLTVAVGSPSQTINSISAVAAGALRSQGGQAANVRTFLGSALFGSPVLKTQAEEFVDGYTSGATLVALQAQLAGNPNADAVAGGATVRAVLTTSVIVREALVAEALVGGSLTNAQAVVRAVVAANTSQAATAAGGAINPATFLPYGDATFSDVVRGAISAAPIAQVGAVTQTVISKSAAASNALNSATVNGIVNDSIIEADASQKRGAFADIVYKAQFLARNTTGASAPLVVQAINTINSVTPVPPVSDRPHYIALVAALAGDNGPNRTTIRTAGLAEITTLGGDVLAATYGANLFRDILANTQKAYTTTLTSLVNADAGANPNSLLTGSSTGASVAAGLYASIFTNFVDYSAALAAAIKQSSNVTAEELGNLAANAVRVTNPTKEANIPLVRDVANYAKTTSLSETSDPLDYLGKQLISNPSLTKEIVSAWTVVDPNHAHYVSHAVAFNAPSSTASVIGSIFTYAQITNSTPYAQPSTGNPTGALPTSKTYLGSIRGAIIDQPAAAAAITAGMVTGILEAKLSAALEKSTLVTSVSAAVLASITQDGTTLRGPVNPFNAPGDTSLTFRQSDGSVGGLKSGVNARTVGAAGAITGYIAQTTKAGDTSIVKSGETASVAGSVAFAVLQQATTGQAKYYALEIAQAAGQALRWVAGASVSVNAAQAALDIANAIAPSVVGGGFDFVGLSLAQTVTKLQNAAAFGISEAANGTIGAGALGLNATGLVAGTTVVKKDGNANSDFYIHRSATGDPVTDIFNL